MLHVYFHFQKKAQIKENMKYAIKTTLLTSYIL
jgi:hypothetical protein